MVFQFYFKKMQSSESLKLLSQRKLADVIERFIGDLGLVRITFSLEKNQQKMHCYFQGWNGTILNASGASENMYATVDVVASKLETQLSRHKMKIRRRSRLPWQRAKAPELALDSNSFPAEAEDWRDAESYSATAYQLVH